MLIMGAQLHDSSTYPQSNENILSKVNFTSHVNKGKIHLK